MQPQGLEALMQSQPAPQMNNPRLAAAVDVVTSDAEEQILDPRTLAMLKYKDALQAMQAADQMMASARPVPTPPTVAERTKLAAEQGIAGLAQRLSPGIQQRGEQMAAQQDQQGSQMAAQQGQQAMPGGGLPQLAAPNMAGMAGGGIIAFQQGGALNPAPTPTKVVPRPVPRGQPNVASQAATSDDVARYIYNYTNLRASMEAATDPQQKAVINQRLQEMQRTFSPDIVLEAHKKMSQQNGMASGGIVGYAGPQGSVVGNTAGSNNPYNIRFDAGNDWKGQGNPTSSGFATFDNLNSGTRAADRVLQSYGLMGISTITDVVNRYAPPNENDTANYIKFVSDQTGIPSNQPIDLDDPGTRNTVLAAMGKMESGRNDTPEDIAARIAAANNAGQDGGQNDTPENIAARIAAANNAADVLDDIIGTRAAGTDVEARPSRNGMTDAEIESRLNTPRSRSGQAIFDAGEYIYENPVDAGLGALTLSGVGGPIGVGRAIATRVLPKLYQAAKAAMTPGGRTAIGGGGLALSNMLGSEGDDPAATPIASAAAPTTDLAAAPTVETPPTAVSTGFYDNFAPTADPTADPAAAAPTNAALEELLALSKGEPGKDAGSRYRELTGMEDAIKERRVEQDRLRALQEARFSPEQERSRLLRAGLAGLASRGLGGFSSGMAGEEAIIAGERDTAQQRVVADMDKTINELRALGLGQFQAEQTAAQIHSTQLAQLAELEQNERLADRASRERGESDNRADRRLLAQLAQTLTIEELRQAQEAASDLQVPLKDVYTLAADIMGNSLPGTMTFTQALEQVRNAAAGVPIDAATEADLGLYAPKQ